MISYSEEQCSGPQKILTFTEAAAQRLQALVAQAPEKILGIRIGLKKSGCAGLAYTVEYAKEKKPGDEVLDVQGVSVFVGADSLLFLFGTHVDYNVTPLSAAFSFHNPNQTSACGCGESVTIKPKNP
jgi:iron-sulfur cluster assembly protein